MIRKVALVQALREAFPARLGALYTAEERGYAEPVEATFNEVPEADAPHTPADLWQDPHAGRCTGPQRCR